MEKLECDLIIVSAGASGLAAAVAAGQKGARVISFEKASTTGGTGNMGMGPFGLQSRRQRLRQMGPTVEEAFKIFMDYTHWRVDARLVKAYLEKSATTIDWLEDMGAKFLDPLPYFPGGWPTWHIVAPGGEGCARNLYKLLTDKAKELGVDFRLQTPVKKILKDGNRVTGVVAEDKSGEKIEAHAKAVIVATGGFGDNPQMIKKYTGYDWGKDFHSFRVPGLVGEGIKMAWEAGAAPTDISMEIIYIPPGDLNPELAVAFRQPHLLVNLLGERFINEGIMPSSTFTGNAISRQKDRNAYLIFDEDIRRQMETSGYDFIHYVFPFFKIRDFNGLLKEARDSGYKDVHATDSVDELADKTGIDRDGLKTTIEEYNGFCKNGYDAVFNKEHKYLRPIRTPRFYALKLQPGAYGTLGGIKINHKMEVIDKDWKKIPGLYAAGTDANSMYGDSYVFVLPGNTMGFALNSGRMAAENALESVKTF